MIYKIRIILNTEKDVIRDIAIYKSVTLEDLHNVITNAFGFEGNEMASFYKSDEEWTQGEEFPLFDMTEGLDTKTQMQEISLEEVLKNQNDKLIYVYDFLSMWSFYVELIEMDLEESQEVPCLLFSLGNVPNDAPEIEFESEDLSLNDFEEEDEEEDEFDFNNFEELY